jgi:hypothetical protein
MDARVTLIRPDVDASSEFVDDAWLSTEVSLDPALGERLDPFETVSVEPHPRGRQNGSVVTANRLQRRTAWIESDHAIYNVCSM